MTNLPMFPEHDSGSDDTPLPLLVAKKWAFPLAFHIVEGKHMYAIQDWVRGLLGEEDIRKIWSKFKTQKTWKQMSTISRPLSYKASDSKTYQRDHTTDKGLFLIAQYLRPTETRTVLEEIRSFLASSGAFVDELRRDEDLIVISSKMSPDQMLDATDRAKEAIRKAYRAQGKSEAWIDARMESRLKRNDFTAALGRAIAETLTPRHYATATDDIYTGLWGRTAANLKREMGLSKHANLRDHQPIIGLEYQRIAEYASAQKLGERQELTWDEARDIIKFVAVFVGRQAKEMSELLAMDLATGRPLLARG